MNAYMVWLVDKDNLQNQVACSVEDLPKFIANLDTNLYAIAYIEGARFFSNNYLDFCKTNNPLEQGDKK